jgi:Leucine-rich repeat (LRR) protein
MSHNRLTVLPPDVGYLTHLTQLSALHNAITDVPPDVGNLRGQYLTQNLDVQSKCGHKICVAM